MCSGNHRAVVRALGRRNFCAQAEEYAKRNYACDEPGYNSVMTALTAQRRFCPFLFLPVFLFFFQFFRLGSGLSVGCRNAEFMLS